MKKHNKLLLVLPLLLGSNFTAKNVLALDDVKGGTISFDFTKQEDVDRFDMYSSFLTLPNINGDSLFSYIYAEQKVILKDVQLSNYLIEADFAPSVANGHIDMGFYLKASNPGNNADQINAYNLQIKHDPNEATWFLRVYKYENSIFRGAMLEVADLPYWSSEWLHLSAVVNDGYLKAYINNDYSNPVLSYNIGPGAGLVGVRSFKSPSKVRNISITAPEFALNYQEIDSLLNEYLSDSSIRYTTSSWTNYNKAYIKAKSVRNNTNSNQLDINAAANALKEGRAGLIVKKSFADLQNLINECEGIKDETLYTQNSYKSFLYCLEEAKKLTSSSSVEDISFCYLMLLNRKESLIRYGAK